ncbi:hypothetical protein [Streptomyces sp. G-G2]|uniref:hypothetical protein n=1 Tax=Streptomyces sp. G-G2 TaxID=3046201 RepID=UPI0024BB2F18|nr:hypothetical protein [Streptomyces sp. G-G2]MDJ0380694.1 hypothetical protein [Streptomyces sp. G-G2]
MPIDPYAALNAMLRAEAARFTAPAPAPAPVQAPAPASASAEPGAPGEVPPGEQP